jgi:type IV pilus assembly protein PilO
MSEKKSRFSLAALDPAFEKINKLSRNQRILICVLVFGVMIGASVYFLYMPKHEEIGRLTEQYESLERELADARRRASQLNRYKAEVKEVEAQFEVAKRALPESEEIPSLLTSISHSGQDSGLDFLLFRPERDVPRGFYAEIPVSIEVSGRYHQAAAFFDRVSRLPRIVNVKDIRISGDTGRGRRRGPATADGENRLTIACTAVTYQFVDETSEPEPETPRRRRR